jgi:hypothetical protein
VAILRARKAPAPLRSAGALHGAAGDVIPHGSLTVKWDEKSDLATNRIGPMISRLEDADYDGHSLALLRRIASALEKRVEIRFVAGHKLQHA